MNDDDDKDDPSLITVSVDDMLTDLDGDIIYGDNIGAASMDYSDFYITPTNSPVEVEINKDGVTLKDGADVNIGGQSLSDFMQEVRDRLLILEPNFELMEQYPALKDAYEKYKLIEKLLKEGQKKE